MNDWADFLCDMGRMLGILGIVAAAVLFAVGFGVAAAMFG